MRLPLITVITTILLVSSKHGFALPQGSSSATSSTDPCENSPCGKGAECKSMGSIAICVCPEDGKGDPFIACMKEEAPVDIDHNDADQQSIASSTTSIVAAALPASSRSSDSTSALTSSSSSSSSTPLNMNHFVTSFDIGSVPQSAHQARTVATSSINAVTTPHPPTSTTTSSSSTSVTTERVPIISASTTTTTHSPYIFYQSSSRPATISSSSSNHNTYHPHSPPHQYQPESHRIPIISSAETNHYPNHDTNSYQHRYPPMPITSSPYGSSVSNIFNEKTFAPLADFGMTNSYSYSHRGQTGHLSGSGSHNAYEYDSRPIAGTPSYNILGVSSSSPERYGQHSFHPASSGFPGPITESPTSRYPVSDSSSYNGGSNSGYHHHSPVRNDLSSHSSDSFNRISDPLGKYESCRMVNGVVVCADNSNRGGESGFIHGETTSNYGFHSSRDRDQFSSYYPIPSSSTRYPSSSSIRPTFDYNYVNRRNGYPQHYEERQPLDNERKSYYPFPKEQRISTQSIHTISSSSFSNLPMSSRNDNDHHLCKSMCGINSICRLVLERPVCGCPEGHTGDPSVKCDPNMPEFNRGGQGQGYCQRHVDCRESEVCAKSKCIDPCKEQDQMSTTSSALTGDFSGSSSSARAGGQYTGSLCGTNAQCLVVGHTPLCKCNERYFGNPYVACVP